MNNAGPFYFIHNFGGFWLKALMKTVNFHNRTFIIELIDTVLFILTLDSSEIRTWLLERPNVVLPHSYRTIVAQLVHFR